MRQSTESQTTLESVPAYGYIATQTAREWSSMDIVQTPASSEVNRDASLSAHANRRATQGRRKYLISRFCLENQTRHPPGIFVFCSFLRYLSITSGFGDALEELCILQTSVPRMHRIVHGIFVGSGYSVYAGHPRLHSNPIISRARPPITN